MKYVIPEIVALDFVPKNTIMFIPPVERVVYVNTATGEREEYLEFNPKAGAIIYNIGETK